MENNSNKTIKSYKGFDKNLCCRGFQYEVGKEYEIEGHIKCCERGFHACENPFEVFDYYDMLYSRFFEVEQSGELNKENNATKVCSSKIKIVAELKLADMIRLGIEWIKDITSTKNVDISKYKNYDDKGYARIGLSGDYACIGSSGFSAQIGSSVNYARIGSSGNAAQIGSSGNHASICSSGNYAMIGSSGDYDWIGSSGYCANIGSIGYCARIGSSGNSAQIGSSGDSAKIGSSGDHARIDSSGEDSVICCAGNDSAVRAKIGSWITLAEWIYSKDKDRMVPVYVKTEYVDGKHIKADTWYRIVNGEFVECKP